MQMDIEKIKRLIQLIEESSVTEIEIQEEGRSIRISKAAPVLPQVTPPFMHIMPTPPVPPAPTSTVNHPTTTTSTESASPKAPAKTIKSPMVGTFYAAPTPDSKPFLQVGQSVNTGDAVCIIEAMKMFNEIEAEQSGIVKKILVENGQPVEYEQPLFELE